MSFDLEYVNCNFCNKADTRLYATASYVDYIKRRPEIKKDSAQMLKKGGLESYKFSLVKCKDCGLIYVNPRPTNISALYDDKYFSYYTDTKSEAHKKREETFNAEIADLERLVKKFKIEKKILDVGCGGGFFLASLNDSWEKYGNEANPVAAKYARDIFGINVLEGDLGKVDFADETFGVIKMRGVIEHLSDPMNELYKIYRILRKGGVIAINTPNIDSLCGRIYKEKFRMVCPPEHLYYFSTKTMSLMLKKVGFKICKVSYHYFNTPYFNWKDPLKIFWDIISMRISNPNAVSPSFYGNVVDIYATKARS